MICQKISQNVWSVHLVLLMTAGVGLITRAGQYLMWSLLIGQFTQLHRISVSRFLTSHHGNTLQQTSQPSSYNMQSNVIEITGTVQVGAH